MAAYAGKALMDEICEQFLICKICFETYKNPKSLACLHVFCEECLVKHREAEMDLNSSYRYAYYYYSRTHVSCPICRKKTELPPGGIKRLPDNFLVSSLNDIIERRTTDRNKESGPVCEICNHVTGSACGGSTSTSVCLSSKEADRTRAALKCLDCVKLLCKDCAETHRRTKVTRGHSLVDVVGCTPGLDVQCRLHRDELVRFYCEPCDVCVCILCTFHDHKDHKLSTFAEGIDCQLGSLDALLDECRDRCFRLRQELDLIAGCESGILRTEERIRDTAIDYIAAVRRKEKETLDELQSVYSQDDTREFLQQKQLVQETLQNLESTCQLTEIILRDRSVELLLLKKQISGRFERSPPDTNQVGSRRIQTFCRLRSWIIPVRISQVTRACAKPN